MRLYELVLVLNSSLSEAQRKKLTDTIKGWLKPARHALARNASRNDASGSQGEAGGAVKIVKEEELGQKPLSYPIKKEVAGVYLDWSLETEAIIPQDFEKRLLTNENVLRHLLIRRK